MKLPLVLFLGCLASLAIDAKERNAAIEVLRGGAWNFHVGPASDPCAFERTNCTFTTASALSATAALTTATSAKASSSAFRESASVNDDGAGGTMETMPTVRKSPHAVFSVSSTRINHLDPLAVSFSLQYATPGAGDWIGVFCNDDESKPLPDNEYVDWRYTGGVNAATFQFGPLVNMRCSWQFRYFVAAGGADGKTTVKIGTSPFVRFNRGNKEPLQVHISSTATSSEMRVMWVSAPVQTPTVFYGASPSALTKIAIASGNTYLASDMCHAPATTVMSQYYRDPGTMYNAVMKNLEPESTYYYKVGDGLTESQVFKFKTPPTPGKLQLSKPTSFFVYGDLGDWNIKATGPKPEDRTATTIELMRKDMDDPSANYVAIMHNGDISYAMSRTYLWDQFGAIVQPVATELPYMVGIGNHEYDHTSGGEKDPSGVPGNGFHPVEGNYGSDSYGECGVPTNKRFVMPENGNNVFWWSVEYGLTHHTQISSEHDFTPGAAMYTWLENDLKSVDRKKTPWLLLYLHRPMYTSEMYDSDYRLSLFIRKNLEPLLAKYQVDVVFSGHYHAYELTCPVYNQTCLTEPLNPPTALNTTVNATASDSALGLAKAKAPVHIMVGSAGADVDDVGYFDVPWRVAAELNYGYGRLHVHNASHAQFEFVRNKDKQVTSSAWVISDHDWVINV
ncbi:Inactive purple acid phosphatase 9 [Globisporangium polare]